MKTFHDLHAFENFITRHGYRVQETYGTWSGYAVAIDLRGRPVARCMVTYC
jgi:hypothetical protein